MKKQWELIIETMSKKSIGKDYIQSNGLLTIKPNQRVKIKRITWKSLDDQGN